MRTSQHLQFTFKSWSLTREDVTSASPILMLLSSGGNIFHIHARTASDRTKTQGLKITEENELPL